MKKKLAFSLSVLILCFLGACDFSLSLPDNEYITLRIKGTVTDGANNSPLIARIDLYPLNNRGVPHTVTTTDDKGQYSIEISACWCAPNYGFELVATATGYGEQTHTIAKTENLQIIDFQLYHNSTH